MIVVHREGDISDDLHEQAWQDEGILRKMIACWSFFVQADELIRILEVSDSRRGEPADFNVYVHPTFFLAVLGG